MRALFIVTLMVSASICGAQESATSQQTGVLKRDKDAKICKQIRKTGTHFTRRVCHTKADWDEMHRRAQEEMRKIGPDRNRNQQG